MIDDGQFNILSKLDAAGGGGRGRVLSKMINYNMGFSTSSIT